MMMTIKKTLRSCLINSPVTKLLTLQISLKTQLSPQKLNLKLHSLVRRASSGMSRNQRKQRTSCKRSLKLQQLSLLLMFLLKRASSLPPDADLLTTTRSSTLPSKKLMWRKRKNRKASPLTATISNKKKISWRRPLTSEGTSPSKSRTTSPEASQSSSSSPTQTTPL